MKKDFTIFVSYEMRQNCYQRLLHISIVSESESEESIESKEFVTYPFHNCDTIAKRSKDYYKLDLNLYYKYRQTITTMQIIRH